MFVYGDMNGWGWALMSLGWLVLLVLVGLAVTVLLRHAPDGGADRIVHRHHPEARALLAERYARGEIDDEEYWRRLAILEATAHRQGSR
ncbi:MULTISPECIES: SHOCT domain-containing protein [unclassified Streptomyces]|uniref:SHOCT domain-containing protein n=1 Tax=unclassified Streptomyces TaxID=2593676 RepID=UPI000370A3B1|nr:MULTISPECIES: SHOCT domain-containing protein [unclassified Streptomyces]MYX33057.1 SHOCT domain-containing protein [Streptomyces sp. SID8377]